MDSEKFVVFFDKGQQRQFIITYIPNSDLSVTVTSMKSELDTQRLHSAYMPKTVLIFQMAYRMQLYATYPTYKVYPNK